MALYISSWDIPTDEALIKKYREKSKGWAALVLGQPGVKEFRAYRDPLKNSPSVMIQVEFDNLESLIKYVKSEAYNRVTIEMINLGCSGFVNEMWGASPLMPEPLRP